MMCLEDKGYDLRRNTSKIARCPEKNYNKLDIRKMKENRYSFATKNMAATSNRRTRNKTEQGNQNKNKIETTEVDQGKKFFK